MGPDNEPNVRRVAPGPPWLEPSDWRSVNDVLARLLKRYRREAAGLEESAAYLRNQMCAVFPLLDRLCALSCPWCPEPCCLSARIWWDLRDLLFLHLNRCEIAARQPIARNQRPCHYLGPKGCTLERLNRPWICTWYLCAQQKSYLSRTAPGNLSALQAQIGVIQEGRKQLEAEFIRLTAGKPGIT